MRRASLLAAAACLALGAATLPAEPGAGRAMAGAVARALYEEARALAEAGDWPSASSLLAEARAQDQGDADIRYLSARAALASGASRGEALAQVEAALSSGRFEDYGEAEARILAAELLVAMRRWDDALALLRPRAPEPSLERRWLMARSAALLGLGQAAPCMAELERALRLYPDDPAFPRLVLARVAAGPRALPASPELRALVELALDRARRCATSDPELPVLAAPFMPDRRSASDSVLAFRAAGGRSAAATLLALEYGLADEARAAAELFSGAYPARAGDFARARGLARSPAGMAALDAALASFSGRLEADRDGDGIAEEATVLAKGVATSYALDADQDGEPDLGLSFADGLPLRASLGASGSSFSYGSYPYLEAAELAREGSRVSYALTPLSLSFSPVRMSRIAGEGRAAVYLPEPTGAAPPSERAIAASASTRRERNGEVEELVYLEGGLAKRRELRARGGLVSVTEYSLGRPRLERADLDGDGRFETERAYDGAGGPAEGQARPRLPSLAEIAAPADPGALSSARVDADGDGLFEYREEARFPFRKEWDLDANGQADAVEYRLPDGGLRCEYSSRLDGDLDEILTVKDGEIQAFSKGGTSLALVPDANPGLVWIGRKPFDLGKDFVPAEGLFLRGGLRFKVVKGDRRFFAELVP